MSVEQQEGDMAAAAVRHISTCTVRHSRCVREEERQCHLSPWDLCYLSIHYIQKGLLFLKPPASPCGAVSGGEEEEEEEEGEVVHGSREEGFSLQVVVAHLQRSLSATLDHFYPLSGRLATVQHPDDGGISIFIDCRNHGIEFVQAAADVTVSDLLSPPFGPRIVRSFFPLNDAVSYDGHSLPLLAVQVTELRDGYFVGCSMNHSAADGTSFWHFFNSWSAIARGEGVRLLPVVRRWFPEKLRAPLRLPSPDDPGNQLIRRPLINRELEDTVFHFPRHAIAALKARANAEAGGCGVVISSLQALMAFLWRAVTRARGLPPDDVAIYGVAIGLRQRLQPPPPLGYLGNLMRATTVSATVEELLGRPLGEVAEILNRGIASETDAAARGWAESWADGPNLIYLEGTKPHVLFTGSSPRFDVYGNDFGWGRPVAVRSGMGNKLDGKLTIFSGADEGSMDMEMYLPRQVLLALMGDEAFMSLASLPGSMTPSTPS
ncbi:hypothetical protein Taro_014195 [Colocasia esculenta]|uniref:Acetyltransferase n=1 Tax=Colocasia esculenta TaxID=4460 RepID=A0A843UE30_COLES|nr:hypothetical protein [Colocasia esculenta]